MPNWMKMIPTYIVIVWAVVLTLIVYNNYQAVEANARARANVLCQANNATRTLTRSILATGATGNDPAAIRWQVLQAQLGAELDNVNC